MERDQSIDSKEIERLLPFHAEVIIQDIAKQMKTHYDCRLKFPPKLEVYIPSIVHKYYKGDTTSKFYTKWIKYEISEIRKICASTPILNEITIDSIEHFNTTLIKIIFALP